MHQLEQLSELDHEEQKRADKVVATLTMLGNHGETVAEIAHDARNMVTALDLYCDLLRQPGVLDDQNAGNSEIHERHTQARVGRRRYEVV